MIKLTFANIDEVKPGYTILFDGRYGTLEEDHEYTDSLRVHGSSLRYIIENYKNVYYVK